LGACCFAHTKTDISVSIHQNWNENTAHQANINRFNYLAVDLVFCQVLDNRIASRAIGLGFASGLTPLSNIFGDNRLVLEILPPSAALLSDRKHLSVNPI
jgi:hypothetical protein